MDSGIHSKGKHDHQRALLELSGLATRGVCVYAVES